MDPAKSQHFSNWEVLNKSLKMLWLLPSRSPDGNKNFWKEALRRHLAPYPWLMVQTVSLMTQGGPPGTVPQPETPFGMHGRGGPPNPGSLGSRVGWLSGAALPRPTNRGSLAPQANKPGGYGRREPPLFFVFETRAPNACRKQLSKTRHRTRNYVVFYSSEGPNSCRARRGFEPS